MLRTIPIRIPGEILPSKGALIRRDRTRRAGRCFPGPLLHGLTEAAAGEQPERFWALLPHFIILAFLGIAQFVAFLIAQVVVLVNGTCPAGLHGFVAGVLRWQLRAGAFLLALTDRYPPFGFQPDDEYPVDLRVTYPQRSSRLLAGLTVLFFVVSVGVLAASSSSSSFTRYETLTNLRTVVQIPHLSCWPSTASPSWWSGSWRSS